MFGKENLQYGSVSLTSIREMNYEIIEGSSI